MEDRRDRPGRVKLSGARNYPAYLRSDGDLCIISFLPLQGEVPKAEGVLRRQALSGTCASRTPSVAPRQLPHRGSSSRLRSWTSSGEAQVDVADVGESDSDFLSCETWHVECGCTGGDDLAL